MTVYPYFVKLFDKRLYGMVKFPADDTWMFTLAFDRILSLEVTDDKFEYNKNFDLEAFYKECYGVVRDEDVPPVDVIIRAFGKRADYLRDLPLHHSQVEIATTAEYSDSKVYLRPQKISLSLLLPKVLR